MSSVEDQDRTTLRGSLADARHHLEQLVREKAPDGAIGALQRQIFDILDKLDRLHAIERPRK